MQVILTSFRIVAELLILVGIGMLLKQKNIVSAQTVREMNRLVMLIFIPLNIFTSIYNSDFETDFDGGYILFILAMGILSCLGGVLLARMLTRKQREQSAFAQVSVRPNDGIFGLPLAHSIYGAPVDGVAAISCAFLAPFFNFFAVVLFESYAGGKVSPGKMIMKIIRNPIIIASVIAITIKVINIQLPAVLFNSINYLSRGCTGVSLLVLGTSFNFRNDASKKLISMGLIYKMAIIPVAVMAVSILLGYRNVQLVAILAMFASPCAVSAYSMASGYDADLDLTSSIVVYSYIVCLITLPIIISAVRLLGFI